MGNDPIVRIVDDDPTVRKSLTWLFESVGLKVASYASAEEFLDGYDPAIPGCVVLDVRMPGMGGLVLQEKLHEMNVTVPVLIVTGYGNVPMAVRAIKGGAVDFLQKPLGEQALLDLVHRAIAQDIEERRKHEAEVAVAERMRKLTRRETQIIKLVVAGMSSRQIADELSIALKTVETHRSKIMKKMQARSVPELLLMTLPVLSDAVSFANSRPRRTSRLSTEDRGLAET